jgi:DNA-binding response OmpR family regulator
MPPHILIVDDQISLPQFIEMELASAGYRVSLCGGNIAELAAIQADKPDLILLNWELRKVSAYELYRRFKLDDSQVPIVIITASGEINIRAILNREVQPCLTKPFSMPDLLSLIEFHLSRQNVGV